MYLKKKGLLLKRGETTKRAKAMGCESVTKLLPKCSLMLYGNLHQMAQLSFDLRDTMKHTLTLLLLTVLAAVAYPKAVNAQRWLHYEPETVELEGRLVIESKFGPPNYGEQPKTDQKVKIPVLMLPYRASMFPTAHGDNTNPVYSIRQIQLAFGDKTASYKNLIGKDVVVTGTLFKAHTGHHYTEVVLTIGSIRVKPAIQQPFDVCRVMTSYVNLQTHFRTSNSMLTEFRAVVGKEPTEKSFKHSESGLVISMAVKYEGPDAEKSPTYLTIGLAMSNKEEDVFEFTDNAEAATTRGQGWRFLSVEKHVVVGDKEHRFDLSCWNQKEMK
jgi:hypothetical protein